jgi:hypothetical protein
MAILSSVGGHRLTPAKISDFILNVNYLESGVFLDSADLPNKPSRLGEGDGCHHSAGDLYLTAVGFRL